MATNAIIEKVTSTDGGANRIASTFYCTCSTAAATAQKDATPADSCVFNDNCLITGVTVHVKFTNSNTHATPTLKVGTATAKQIMKYGTTKPGTTATTSWQAGSVLSFTYDGTYWQMNDHLDDTNTDSYISAAGFDWGSTHDEVTMTLTRSGTSSATISANIPKFNDQRGGTVPKGESVSTQSQSTKFLRSDGSWAAPSYTGIPSNNVTGSGTSGYLAKWTGANTLGNGPQLGNGTTTYLRNDGTWATPPNDKVTQTYATTGDNAYLLLSGSVSASTTTEGVRKTGQLSQRMDDMVVSSTGGQESDRIIDNYKYNNLLNSEKIRGQTTPSSDLTDIQSSFNLGNELITVQESGESQEYLLPQLSFSRTDQNDGIIYQGRLNTEELSMTKIDESTVSTIALNHIDGLKLYNSSLDKTTWVKPGLITVDKVECNKMSVSSKTNVTFSKTSGVQTSANDAFFRRSGNVVQLNIYFKGNGSSTAVGTNVIEGSFSSNLPAPSEATRLIGYYSSTHFMGTLYTNRTFQLRLLGAAVNISTSNTVLLSGTYITDET